MIENNNFYCNKVVYKPWGYEYVIYSSANRLAITFLKINYGQKTSLHCHPKKKTGFIILSGKALVQIGLYKENNKIYNPLSRLVFRPGLFHSIKSASKQGLFALEFETPFKKNDLVRFKDAYVDSVTVTGDVSVGDDLTVEGGVIDLKNTGSQSELRMYCESSNAHYAALKAPAHSHCFMVKNV